MPSERERKRKARLLDPGEYQQMNLVLARLHQYHATINQLRPLKRPMLLWSVIALVYVYSGLHFEAVPVSSVGLRIIGLTESTLSSLIFLATLYYLLRWGFNAWLHLRFYWQIGFFSALWASLSSRAVAETTWLSPMQGDDIQPTGDRTRVQSPSLARFEHIKGNPYLSGSANDFSWAGPWSLFVRVLEYVVVPFVLPALIVWAALVSLWQCKLA